MTSTGLGRKTELELFRAVLALQGRPTDEASTNLFVKLPRDVVVVSSGIGPKEAGDSRESGKSQGGPRIRATEWIPAFAGMTRVRTIAANMRSLLATLGFVMIVGAIAVRILPAKERDHRQPIAWCYVQEGPLELTRKGMGRRTSPLSLSRGALVPVLKTESKNGRTQAMVRVTDLATLDSVDGWVDSSKAEIIPVDRFPSDEEVLRQLSIEPPSGFTGTGAGVARWLVKQGDSGAALVCFVASFGLAASRLAAFLPKQGNFVCGPWLEFPFSDMKPGILFGEVRDLLGDGVECLITHEPFREGPATLGVNIVIRRLERGNFSTLWTAPLESQNLGFFPPQVHILQPPERNAGAPGTVTKGEVEFQPRGRIYIPVWKATVEFFAVGQDKPIDSVKVSKACAWNGSEFQPVR